MNRNGIAVVVIAGTSVVASAVGIAYRWRSEPTKPAVAQVSEAHGHEARHDGSLNAVEACAVGHAEVKVEGDVLRLWFVGGEGQTDKAVRVTDKQVILVVKGDGGQDKTLTLEARPNELAEETVGDCSYFEGKADWLASVKTFQASGKVNLKGKERSVRIDYPDGYDPDEQAEQSGGAAK
jgi:hypothetical protein